MRRGRKRTPLEHIEILERYTILVRHARLMRNGRTVVLCTPSYEERHRGVHTKSTGSNWKVIFDSRKQAEDCIKELRRLPGVRPMIAYPCPRSRHGHYHIATDKDTLFGTPKPVTSDEAARRRQDRAARRRAAKRGEDPNDVPDL